MHSKQRVVWDAVQKNRFVVLAAGRRFGKTILAVIVLLINALSHKDSLYWFVAPSYRQAKMIAWRMLKTYSIFFNPKFNESELSVTFPNGAVIELKGADNEDSLRGTGVWGMVIDEFATIYNSWSVWHEVLRPALTDRKGWTLFISTPKGKDAFFELYLKGQRREDGFISFQYKTINNPYIDPKEVEEARRTMPTRYFKQEYEASFEDYIGLIWPEFTKKHIIEPYYLQQAFSRVGAIDPAVTGTTAALKVAVDDEGDIIVYEELYEKDKRVSEAAEAIQEDDVYWLIDPASKARHREKEGELYSLYDEYADNGIVAYPAEHDVEAGINRVGEFFKQHKIKIFNTCKKLIWELERYHWAELKEAITGEQKPKPFKKDDHLCDCFIKDTKVFTKDGEKPINEIRVDELVLTRDGWNPVETIFAVGTRDTYRVKFSDGRELVGTANHPIWLEGSGFKSIAMLRYGDIIRLCPIQTNIGEKLGNCGKNILEKSQEVLTSITRMVTKRIMLLKTFCVYHGKNIHNIIMTIWRQPSHFVRIVVRNIVIKFHSNIANFAPLIVNPIIDGNQELIMSKEVVRDVVKSLQSTNTKKESFVQRSVEIQENTSGRNTHLPAETVNNHSQPKLRKQFGAPAYVVSVIPDKPQKVYNLTVANKHEYYANGILVSNCLRYIIMSRTQKPDMNYEPVLSHTSPQYKMLQLRKRRKEYNK